MLALVGVAAVGALPVAARASDIDVAERDALLAHFIDRSVGFDLLKLGLDCLSRVGLSKWAPELTAILGEREHARGFRSLQEMSKDATFGTEADGLMARMAKDLRTKLVLRKLAKRAPQTADAQRQLLDSLLTDWLGVDLQRMRDHTATYPDGLLVVVGPPTHLYEMFYSTLREPFLRYLEVVHGHKARVWVCGVDDQRLLLEGLLDPAVRVVAFVGHGSWTAFSLRGLAGDPMAGFATVCENVKAHPAEFLPKVFANDHRAAGLWFTAGELEESELATLVAQLHGGNGALSEPKDLVVRYTCGHGRYKTDGDLLWKLLPKDIEPRPALRREGLSGALPEEEGLWEPVLQAWLDEVGATVAITDQPALGTCLVASASDTRGYAGDSWLPDFVEDPVPAHQAPFPWGATRTVDPASATPEPTPEDSGGG